MDKKCILTHLTSFVYLYSTS